MSTENNKKLEKMKKLSLRLPSERKSCYTVVTVTKHNRCEKKDVVNLCSIIKEQITQR